jgi:cell division transport system permease protein
LNPRFFLAEALRSIRANAAVSIAATVTVLIAVFILGAFIPSFLYVQSTVDAQKERVDINVFISDSATVPQVEGLRSQLTALQEQGEIESFVYVSKDEALVKLRERLNDTSILEDLPGNPLPASFEVKPTDPARSDAIIAQLQDSPAIDTELGISYGKEAADRLLSVARFIQWAGLGLISILLVASILLIGNTIRLSIFARRREVEVMKLVGATNWFIRWPFVIEGIFVGFMGGVLAVLLLTLAKETFVDPLEDRFALLAAPDTIDFPLLAALLLLACIAVSSAGSALTLRRFLRV